MRVRRILLDEHSERLRRNRCPKCNNHPLHRVEVADQQHLPRTKYKIVDHFWTCSGPDSFNCYFISSISGDTVFESTEGVSIIDFEEIPVPRKGGKIVKRTKSGHVIDLTPMSAR
jgi:hypothetical protein